MIPVRQRFGAFRKTRAFLITKVAVLCLVAIELLYVLGSNVLLASGAIQKVVNATGSAHLEFDSGYSIIPSHVHVTNLRLRYEDHNMQFAFSITEADVTVNLLWLLKKRFSASSVRASGVSFLFRHKVAQVQGHEQALALYPPIPGFDGPPLLGVAKHSNPKDLWSFELVDVDAKIRELWFMTYRYLGPAQAKGGFLLVPYRNLEVNPAHLTLLSGALSSGERKILSRDFHGEVDVHLDPVNPEALIGMSVFAPISATVRLSAQIENLEPVNLYLPAADRMRVLGGGGNLDTAVVIKHGKVAPGTTVTYRMLAPVRTERPPLAAAGVVELKFSVARTKTAQIALSSGRIELMLAQPSTPNRASLAVAERVRWVAAFPEIDLTHEIKPSRLWLDVPVLKSSHLENFNTLIPPPRTGQLLGGSATFAATAQSSNGVTHAVINGDFEALQIRIREHQLWGFGKLKATYEANSADQSSRLKDVEVLFNNVTVLSRDERTSDWWASVSTAQVQLEGPPGRQLGGTIVARAKDPEPVLNALDVPGIARLLIPDKPVEAVAKLEQRGDVTHLELIQAKTGGLNVRGELRRRAERTSGAFRVEGIAIPIGIAIDKGESSLTLFASKNWLVQHRQQVANGS